MPGGINAVLALASSVDANVALVYAKQTLRLFAMVLLAPLALKWWLDRPSPWQRLNFQNPGQTRPHTVAASSRPARPPDVPGTTMGSTPRCV
ncbi:AbrB family transcriptional regulator [Mycobacterium hodleri]|uniref:AbrB family transcriptional regulator n=1 Tax=Mycolicibacterium hodleri TaxID=49897 RepID=UPI0021F3B4C3|nr:AbrB family transcriptional regulator [Mycolicibacterium hodleri]MCV7133204.1 AbrB family transcriptional regulator [Mycolicibacterium hodleri]